MGEEEIAFGKVGMAAGFAIPPGIFMAGRVKITFAVIGAAVLFLPKLIQRAMKADTDAAMEAFGRNEQVKKVFGILFMSMAGLVLVRVLDPIPMQQEIGIIAGLEM